MPSARVAWRDDPVSPPTRTSCLITGGEVPISRTTTASPITPTTVHSPPTAITVTAARAPCVMQRRIRCPTALYATCSVLHQEITVASPPTIVSTPITLESCQSSPAATTPATPTPPARSLQTNRPIVYRLTHPPAESRSTPVQAPLCHRTADFAPRRVVAPACGQDQVVRRGWSDRWSDEAAVGGPAGQFVAVGELELAQHAGDVGLDRLDRDEQLAGHFLVGIAARDQPQYLALPLGEPVQVLVDRGDVDRPGERVQHEPGQPRREDRVAVGHPADRVDQFGA